MVVINLKKLETNYFNGMKQLLTGGNDQLRCGPLDIGYKWCGLFSMEMFD